MISLVFAAALLAGAPAADPATPAAAATTAAATGKPKPAPDEVVCKKEAVVGSRMKERICMTQREWDTRKHDDQDMLKRAQDNQPFRSN